MKTQDTSMNRNGTSGKCEAVASDDSLPWQTTTAADEAEQDDDYLLQAVYQEYANSDDAILKTTTHKNNNNNDSCVNSNISTSIPPNSDSDNDNTTSSLWQTLAAAAAAVRFDQTHQTRTSSSMQQEQDATTKQMDEDSKRQEEATNVAQVQAMVEKMRDMGLEPTEEMIQEMQQELSNVNASNANKSQSQDCHDAAAAKSPSSSDDYPNHPNNDNTTTNKKEQHVRQWVDTVKRIERDILTFTFTFTSTSPPSAHDNDGNHNNNDNTNTASIKSTSINIGDRLCHAVFYPDYDFDRTATAQPIMSQEAFRNGIARAYATTGTATTRTGTSTCSELIFQLVSDSYSRDDTTTVDISLLIAACHRFAMASHVLNQHHLHQSQALSGNDSRSSSFDTYQGPSQQQQMTMMDASSTTSSPLVQSLTNFVNHNNSSSSSLPEVAVGLQRVSLEQFEAWQHEAHVPLLTQTIQAFVRNLLLQLVLLPPPPQQSSSQSTSQSSQSSSYYRYPNLQAGQDSIHSFFGNDSYYCPRLFALSCTSTNLGGEVSYVMLCYVMTFVAVNGTVITVKRAQSVSCSCSVHRRLSCLPQYSTTYIL
jgi:hypothetical protein